MSKIEIKDQIGKNNIVEEPRYITNYLLTFLFLVEDFVNLKKKRVEILFLLNINELIYEELIKNL